MLKAIVAKLRDLPLVPAAAPTASNALHTSGSTDTLGLGEVEDYWRVYLCTHAFGSCH